MKDKKVHPISTKLNDLQLVVLDKLVSEGKVKTRAAAIQYLINMYVIKGSI